MKTIWLAVLLSSLPIAASNGVSDALSDAGQLRSNAPASSSVAATRHSPAAEVGPLALDASAGRRASASTGNDKNLAGRLSEYVFLHRTRDEHIAARSSASLARCPE